MLIQILSTTFLVFGGYIIFSPVYITYLPIVLFLDINVTNYPIMNIFAHKAFFSLFSDLELFP